MATYNLIVPEKNLISPTSWGNRATITRVVDNIVTKFGKFIKWSSETSNIPAEVIASFIAVESTGNPLASAGGDGHVTQGLMQWDRRFARNFLEAENRMGRLSKSEKDKYDWKFRSPLHFLSWTDSLYDNFQRGSSQESSDSDEYSFRLCHGFKDGVNVLTEKKFTTEQYVKLNNYVSKIKKSSYYSDEGHEIEMSQYLSGSKRYWIQEKGKKTYSKIISR
jgi:hypothetical protein